MKKLRVYLDTSVIGGCFDAEFSIWSVGLLRDIKLGSFRAVISPIVADEVSLAPENVQQALTELLQSEPEVIAVTEEALRLTEKYIGRGILPERFRNDLLHIAVATIAEVDIVVSWNFKHIVHYDKIRLFDAVNMENGYKSIEIYSPREITHYGEEGI